MPRRRRNISRRSVSFTPLSIVTKEKTVKPYLKKKSQEIEITNGTFARGEKQ
jgi:hypothetical protein